MIFISLAKSHPSPTYGFQLDCAEKRSETSFVFIYHKETAKTAEMFLMGREGKWQQPSLYLPPLAQSAFKSRDGETETQRGGRLPEAT